MQVNYQAVTLNPTIVLLALMHKADSHILAVFPRVRAAARVSVPTSACIHFRLYFGPVWR